MNNQIKPKRKHPYLYIPTGEIVYLDRIVDSQHYFVCWGEDFTLEDKYDRVKVSDLKEINSKPARVVKEYKTAEIKKMSTRLQKLTAAYLAQRKVYLKAHPICEANLQGCTIKAATIHHKKGRLEYLLDETTWLPCCLKCHQYIETHPEFAKAKGFSENRLTKTPDVTELMEKDLTNIKRHGNSDNSRSV